MHQIFFSDIILVQRGDDFKVRVRKNIRPLLRDLNIGSKISLMSCSVLFVVVIVVFVLGLLTNRESSYAFAQKVAEEQNRIVTQSIEEMLKNAENMSSLILYNNNIQNYLRAEGIRQQLETAYSLKNVIQYVKDNSVGISNIVLYRNNGDIITSNHVNMASINKGEFATSYKKMQENGTSIVWQDMHGIDYHIFPDERFAISLYRNVISIYTGERIGMMVLNINENNILSCYEAELNNDTQIYLVNNEGNIISCVEHEHIFQPFDELGTVNGDHFIDNNGQEFLFSQTEVKPMHWSLIRLDRYDAVMRGSWRTIKINLLICVCVFSITTLVIFRYTHRITEPLLQLSKVMDNSEEQIWLRQKLHNVSNDEVGRLIRSFNNMQQRMALLVERIRFEQEQKSKMEMLALQSQIKPHFLYNTLESVCALVQLSRNDDAIHMLKSIENFYRGSLSRGAYLITVHEEIDITRQYVSIQTYRYFGRLTVDYYISNSILDCLIPKLTFQPFLENAIYHGLKNGGKDGLIEIRERHDDKSIIWSISDNGDGFDINAPRKHAANERGYGIINIHNSIKTCFGSEYGVSIKSSPGKGTIVFIHMPICRKTDEEGTANDSPRSNR